jgi:hypothetical protein
LETMTFCDENHISREFQISSDLSEACAAKLLCRIVFALQMQLLIEIVPCKECILNLLCI